MTMIILTIMLIHLDLLSCSLLIFFAGEVCIACFFLKILYFTHLKSKIIMIMSNKKAWKALEFVSSIKLSLITIWTLKFNFYLITLFKLLLSWFKNIARIIRKMLRKSVNWSLESIEKAAMKSHSHKLR